MPRDRNTNPFAPPPAQPALADAASRLGNQAAQPPADPSAPRRPIQHARLGAGQGGPEPRAVPGQVVASGAVNVDTVVAPALALDDEEPVPLAVPVSRRRR
jgi:hypothetical protein